MPFTPETYIPASDAAAMLGLSPDALRQRRHREGERHLESVLFAGRTFYRVTVIKAAVASKYTARKATASR